MKWLLTRLATACLMMGTLCSVAIAVGRLDHSPSKLQALGIDVCDGESCFRGIKIGTDWRKVKDTFPEAELDFPEGVNQGYLHIENSDGIHHLDFYPSLDSSTVDAISVEPDQPFPVSVEDLIAQYGIPCRVGFGDWVGLAGDIDLIYPSIDISIESPLKLTYNVKDYRLEGIFLVTNFTIGVLSNIWGTCNDPVSEYFGPWHGFTSAIVYRQYNVRDMKIAVLTLSKP